MNRGRRSRLVVGVLVAAALSLATTTAGPRVEAAGGLYIGPHPAGPPGQA
ncbi:hypothetical protein Daura_20745 [Dactylosporangium aurantiacum]|uniref:Uncharacterized protein n=1 Tax=Dactylosporangium aurantiacum TaxID=35754 RepID=A0A9Q9ILK6_9ACTN|nr:hypothetical protein [Dactylosporangium aurantiacum]MDG6109993.1 hypothetical protein [Dactylosporangium aurantiacum]UWZ58394.1 hypothetical protein Daura_20745 [Dactylosporangium aurantiacum]